MIRFIELFAGIGGFRYGLESIDRTQDRGSQEDTQRVSKEGQRLYTTQNETSGNNRGRHSQLRNSNKRYNSMYYQCVWANEIDKYACEVYRRNYGKESIVQPQGEEGTRMSRCSQPKWNSSNCKGKSWEDNKDCPELYEGDITKVKADDIPNHDLITAGFPCQAFSIAGKRRGFDDTRGTLFFEIARICRAKKPRYILLENVKGLLSHESGQTFQTILKVLSDIGYVLQWEVLNSKNFGVPQNRERVFIVGHLREERRPEVFPIGEGSRRDFQEHEEGQRVCANTLKARDFKGGGNLWSDEQNTQERGDKSNGSNSIRRTSYTDDMRIRRLTPLECERLQGFPDGWTEGISDTQRYKCLGNAVTTNVITEIGRRLAEGDK